MDGNIKAYQRSDTMGKSPLELVIKVYDGAITAFQKASEAIENKQIEEFRVQLEKVKKFLTHLYTTLDMEKGGEIAARLSQLYSFVINQTNVIEATKDIKLIDDNIHILKNLREGWQELHEQMKQEESAESAEPEPAANLTVSG